MFLKYALLFLGNIFFLQASGLKDVEAIQSNQIDFEPISFSDSVEQLIRSNAPLTESVKKLLAEQSIPISYANTEFFVLDDVTSETVGRAKKAIIRIGYVKRQEESVKNPEDRIKVVLYNNRLEGLVHWIYIFKETNDPQELRGVYDAYQHFNHGVIRRNGYSLKMAWHEMLWTTNMMNGAKRHFALLHAARGHSLRSICEKFMNFPNINRENRSNISLFKEDGSSAIYNEAFLKPVKEAYFAFGTMLGAYCKKYQGAQPLIDERGHIFDMPDLDPHGNNIFYDPERKTITWIDLQKTGEFLTSRVKDSLQVEDSSRNILLYALPLEFTINGKLFSRVIALYSRAAHSILAKTEKRLELMTKFIAERDKIYLMIQEIVESFYNGFISNWDFPQDQGCLLDYFRNNNPFAYKSVDSAFSNPANLLVFGVNV
ncbi:MAG: hypothetical protein HEEMFOPI_01028 [Holosporales bacterium]